MHAPQTALAYDGAFSTVFIACSQATTPSSMSTPSTIPANTAIVPPSRRLSVAPMMDWTDKSVFMRVSGMLSVISP
jgi:hypothetical protein